MLIQFTHVVHITPKTSQYPVFKIFLFYKKTEYTCTWNSSHCLCQIIAIISKHILDRLTPWNRVLENLLTTHLVRNLPTLCWTWRSITCVHQSPLPAPPLRQMNPVHFLTPYKCKTHFNIILTSICKSPKRNYPFGFSD